MSYPPQPPYQPVPGEPGPEHRYTAPGWPPQPMPSAKKKAGPGRVALFVVLGIVGLLCTILGLGAILSDDPKTAADTAVAAATTTGATPAVAPTVGVPEAAAATPKAADFKLTPKVIDKQCFGSAGCSVDIEVRLDYDGPALSEDDTWRVTYEVTGDEDGPIVGTTEVVGRTYDVNEESLSTKSSKTKISIKVTEVEKRGL